MENARPSNFHSCLTLVISSNEIKKLKGRPRWIEKLPGLAHRRQNRWTGYCGTSSIREAGIHTGANAERWVCCGPKRRWRNVKPSLATSVDAILPPYRLDVTLSTRYLPFNTINKCIPKVKVGSMYKSYPSVPVKSTSSTLGMCT